MKYYGCAYYPEYWGVDRVATDARLMRKAGINLVRLAEFAWTGSGQEYATSVEKISLSGTVASKNSLGLPWGGAFRYYDEQDVLTNDTGAFVYIYNTTFDQVPNVRNLGGKWVIRNAWQAGNTLRLTITPDPVVTNTMSAVISGSDSMGNTFSGSITINVSPVPHNVYDVSLGMNRNRFALSPHESGWGRLEKFCESRY